MLQRSGSSIATIRDIIGDNYYSSYEIPQDDTEQNEVETEVPEISDDEDSSDLEMPQVQEENIRARVRRNY